MTGLIEHPDQYFHIQLRDDYLAIYEGLADILSHYKPEKSASSDCKAMIASVFENWMESKSRKSSNENDWWVYFTIDEIEHQLRYRYKRNVIIQSLQEMTEEGYYVDEEGNTYTGTIKRELFIQNTYKYQLNLPVINAFIQALPEQSPYNPKQRPNLGRPKKSNGEVNSLKINGINSNGFSQENGTKINDISEYRLKKDGFTAKNGLKINAPFYTQITTNTDLLDSQIVSGIFALAQMPSSWLIIQPFSIFTSEDWQTISDTFDLEKTQPRLTAMPKGQNHAPSNRQSQSVHREPASVEGGTSQHDLSDTENHSQQISSFPPTVEPGQGRSALSGAPVMHSKGQVPTLDTGTTVPPLRSASVDVPLPALARVSPHEGQGASSPQEDKTPTNGRLPIVTPDHNRVEEPPAPSKQDVNITQASLIPQVATSTVEEWTLAHDQYVEKLRSEWKTASKDAKQWYGNKWDNYKNRFLGEWKKTHPKPIELPAISPEAKAVLDCWRSLFKRQSPITPSDIKGAEMLVESKPTCEELAACRQWMFDTDDPNRPWYRKKGLGLLDVAKDFGKWQSTLDAARTRHEPPPKKKDEVDKSKMFNMKPIRLETTRNKGGVR